MDYRILIDEFYNKQSNSIIEQLKEYKKQSRTFIYGIDNIRRKISDERYDSLIGQNNDIFNNAVYDFNHSDDFYEKDTSINLVIEKEISKEFNVKIKLAKLVDQNRKEILSYTFERFVSDLIEYDVLGRIGDRLSLNSELYKLCYDANNYDNFTLEWFDGHVVNSNLYRKLFSKLNPNIFIPKAIKKTDDFGNVLYDIIRGEEDIDKTDVKVKSKIKSRQEFELDEQALILNLCFEDKNSIPKTEKVKLIILIGEIKEELIFKQSSSNNVFYSKVNNGILRRGSIKTMIDIIESIETKINAYNLKITNQTLKKHKTTLISEQNQAK